ncbi:MAG: site-2 protease family protein [Isosphaeraceae bacterium]
MSFEPSLPSSTVLSTCPQCGVELAPSLLSCPACHRLIHAEELKALAREADAAEQVGDLPAALAAWRQAAALLPSGTRQYQVILQRIAELSRQVESGPRPLEPVRLSNTSESSGEQPAQAATHGWSGGKKATGIAGTIALAAWKFKFVTFLILGKAKLLVLGLTKASTFLSMFAMIGVYWTAFGFWFALGLVLSIYVHEMGHVAALARYGYSASAPLFIPGLGAFIRLKQDFTDPRQDARVGLAGPLWGLGAAVFCALVFAITQVKIWAALAQFGAFINLFNMLPIWQLDGGRAFRGLNRSQRWLAAAALAFAWAVTEDGFMLLLTIIAAWRALADKPADRPDRVALVQYIALIAALSFLNFAPALRVH